LARGRNGVFKSRNSLGVGGRVEPETRLMTGGLYGYCGFVGSYTCGKGLYIRSRRTKSPSGGVIQLLVSAGGSY
jgi:hypothetical protein